MSEQATKTESRVPSHDVPPHLVTPTTGLPPGTLTWDPTTETVWSLMQALYNFSPNLTATAPNLILLYGSVLQLNWQAEGLNTTVRLKIEPDPKVEDGATITPVALPSPPY